jgi:hypothetical protein
MLELACRWNAQKRGHHTSESRLDPGKTSSPDFYVAYLPVVPVVPVDMPLPPTVFGVYSGWPFGPFPL